MANGWQHTIHVCCMNKTKKNGIFVLSFNILYPFKYIERSNRVSPLMVCYFKKIVEILEQFVSRGKAM